MYLSPAPPYMSCMHIELDTAMASIANACLLIFSLHLLLPRIIMAANTSIPAIFIFGDSTVDPGNNNFIQTVFKSNFPPYGIDYPNKKSTGRFTDGKLATDFIASYAGLKEEVPAYLDSTLTKEELLTGVSFASAGSGYDPFTSKISKVISLPNQLDNFIEYKQKLQHLMGKEAAEDHIKRSVFIVSSGTNDFVLNYFSLPIQRSIYGKEEYQLFLLQNMADFLEGLKSLGANKMVVAGLPPLGCLPVVVTLKSPGKIWTKGCIDEYNTLAMSYNQKLQLQLGSIQKSVDADRGLVLYADIHQPLADMIQSPSKYGFKESGSGCCGTGHLELAMLCNNRSSVCSDVNKYVFWDAIHPTEKTYYNLFQALLPTVDLLLR